MPLRFTQHLSTETWTTIPRLLLVATASFLAVSVLLLHRLEYDVEVKHRGTFSTTTIVGETEPHSSPDTIVQQAEWHHPFIHLVNTRFMQHQGDLVDLGRARLRLFETFCLKSVVGQTILQDTARMNLSPLLWIIKVDPQLNATLLDELVSLVRPYPFVFVVASNVNFGVGVSPGGWRGGEAGKDILDSPVHSGDMNLLRRAHAAREIRAILDTRLDADDGLHAEYLETIQLEALKKLRWSDDQTFRQRERQRWKYWCTKNRLDWDPPPPFLRTMRRTDYGVFLAKRSPKMCITPGITLGVSIGPHEEDILHFPHHQLYAQLRENKGHAVCGGPPKTECLRMLETPLLGAIRSRTPTSAGMRGVLKDEDDYGEIHSHGISVENQHLLEALQTSFHVDLSQITRTNRFLRDNFEGIVADNLRGQCTHGHSCKNSTKEALENWLEHSRSQLQRGTATPNAFRDSKIYF